MRDFYTLTFFGAQPWSVALGELRLALSAKDREGVARHYRALYVALSARPSSDLRSAAAEDLLWHGSSLSRALLQSEGLPKGLRQGALLDLEALLTQLGRDWTQEASRALGHSLPPLTDLAPPSAEPLVQDLAQALDQGDAGWLLGHLQETYRKNGTGPLARFAALRWVGGALEGVLQPVRADMNRLVGLERQLTLLKENTLAFLSSKPAQHALLYGPRGSGKSTAIRSLLGLYGSVGLRLLELAPHDLSELHQVLAQLRGSPHRFILFVDDLAFETGDTRYQPLKTLLDGSLAERPGNVLIYATSNRRHLVKEQFKDRPDPLDDDVHAWDTHNERLALSDRFGLTITFPNATQARYLEVVAGLAEQSQLDEDLSERAIRFAEWGNGYSGRTAQQFMDAVRAGQA